MSSCFRSTIGCLFHYETYKILDIRNKKVGALFRLTQLIILGYALFSIIYKKGYQNKDTAISTVRTKLKGIAFVNFTNFSSLYNGIEVYDSADYVIPSNEHNSFFVMTNMIITPNQTQGRCPENAKFDNNWCESDAECMPPLVVVRNGNGIRTGSCVNSTNDPSIKVCEIYGWCPTETMILPMPGQNFSSSVPLLDLAKEFTVLVKNQIRFPKFNVIRRNIISENDTKYLTNCMYDTTTNNRCPIFKLKDIVGYCGDNFTKVAYEGATYGIMINWDCDLDYSPEHCIPTYSFRRLDDPDAPIAAGYNFRYSEYFVINNVRHRTLTKAYGLKFEVLVNAKAGKFAPEPLFVELGAAVALFTLCTVICDVVVVYCVKKKMIYSQHKYQTVDSDVEYTPYVVVDIGADG